MRALAKFFASRHIGLVFAILDAGRDVDIIIPTLKITKEKEGKSYLFIGHTLTYISTRVPRLGEGTDGTPTLIFEERGPYYNSISNINEGKDYLYKQNEIK